jgi:hypothetical protein
LYSGGADEILCYLSLPALETLFLEFKSIFCFELSQFLERSSPPLQKLVVGYGCTSLNYSELDQCLRLVPSLMHLELYVLEDTLLDDFFSALADFPARLALHFLGILLSDAASSAFSLTNAIRLRCHWKYIMQNLGRMFLPGCDNSLQRGWKFTSETEGTIPSQLNPPCHLRSHLPFCDAYVYIRLNY